MVGFGGGCVLALISTAADFAWRGWIVVAGQALVNLMLYPYLCVLLAINLSRQPGERLSLGRVRFTIGTFMILIAYLAPLFGVGVEGHRIGGAAQQYHARKISARDMAVSFREIARKSATEAPMRRHNAQQLRDGRIPDGILDGQKTFLKSLEKNATPEYRSYRFGLIADGEDLQLKSAEANLSAFEKLADYYEQIADKYAKAEQEPWVSVLPDSLRP